MADARAKEIGRRKPNCSPRTSDDEVSLDSLHQRQGVDLHRAALPLLHVGTIRVSLQLALQLVRVEELQSLRSSVERGGRV